MLPDHPFAPFIAARGCVVLDGGLATTLEAHGHDLDDPLWSARLLLEESAAVGRVHREFLAAGADVIATATYQASLPGLAARGLSPEAAAGVLRRGVEIAVRERDAFWADPARRVGRERPLVAASIGPYGAWLADGSEYDGRYAVEPKVLEEFHRERWRILAESGADLLACETLPSRVEIEVLLALVRTGAAPPVWFSFCCRDGGHLWDGTPAATVARACAGTPGVVAVGVNCTAPRHVGPLLEAMAAACDLPLLAYPNAGETYDAGTRTWSAGEDSADPLDAAADWIAAGARALGGCCRVGPERIARLRASLPL